MAFEPRSLTSARADFQEPYLTALRRSDAVVLAPVFHASRLADDERLDTKVLAASLRAVGVDAHACDEASEVGQEVLDRAHPGSVVVTMSSGSFEGLPRKLLANLGENSV